MNHHVEQQAAVMNLKTLKTNIINMKNQTEMLGLLQKKFPKCWFKDGGEFSKSHSGSIWSGEGSEIKGKPLLDAYTSSKKYTLEVHNDMVDFLDKHGWYPELYDSGTVFFYPNN